jgi:hypothetical protein
MFNIPQKFTQGDRLEWSETKWDFDNRTEIMSCFLRGQTGLDLTGIPDPDNYNKWNFEVGEQTSFVLLPGLYNAQFVVFGPGVGRKALGIVSVEVLPSFELLTNLDTALTEEKELEEVEKAIASLSNGVAEYYIGTRKVRYVDLSQLYERQRYLKNRIAKIKNRSLIGGLNVGVNFDRD